MLLEIEWLMQVRANTATRGGKEGKSWRQQDVRLADSGARCVSLHQTTAAAAMVQVMQRTHNITEEEEKENVESRRKGALRMTKAL